MKKVHAIALLVVFGILVATLTISFHATKDLPLRPVAIEEVPYIFEIGTESGVDVESDILRLGLIARGSGSERTIRVNSTEASYVEIRVLGDGTPYLRPQSSRLEIVNGTAIAVFNAFAPADAPLGVYEGTVRFYFGK